MCITESLTPNKGPLYNVDTMSCTSHYNVTQLIFQGSIYIRQFAGRACLDFSFVRVGCNMLTRILPVRVRRGQVRAQDYGCQKQCYWYSVITKMEFGVALL